MKSSVAEFIYSIDVIRMVPTVLSSILDENVLSFAVQFGSLRVNHLS